jgi:hypothetical protein
MMRMKPRMWMKRTSNLTVPAVLALSLALLAPLSAPAQVIGGQSGVQHDPVNRGPIERVVTGKVTNKDGDPIGGAIVYLKDAHSNSVKTYIADDGGLFRFGALSQATDYELWAESSGTRSKSRAISSFDSDNKFYFVLRVNIAKAVSLDGPSL